MNYVYEIRVKSTIVAETEEPDMYWVRGKRVQNGMKTVRHQETATLTVAAPSAETALKLVRTALRAADVKSVLQSFEVTGLSREGECHAEWEEV